MVLAERVGVVRRFKSTLRLNECVRHRERHARVFIRIHNEEVLLFDVVFNSVTYW